MVRAVFNPARTDGFTYTTGANPDHVRASGAVDGAMNEYSYTNQARTQMTFRLNLKSILGADVFKSKDKFSIKLMDINAICEAGNALDMITQNAPSWIRTSNVVMYGPKFVGGQNEVIIGQATTFDDNIQCSFNLQFERADTGYTPNAPGRWLFNRFIDDAPEFYNSYLLPINTNTAEKANRRWVINYRNTGAIYTPTTPTLENVNFTITNTGLATNTNFFWFDTAITGETAQYRTGTGVRAPVTISSLPLTPEQWYMVKRDYTRPNDYGYGIEAWFNKPENDYVEVTLELRDLLRNQLQPVMPIPQGKVLPPFTFVFDIN
jgi:hypothetical protein